MTPSVRMSSIVKQVRSQSHEAPNLRSCRRITPPYCSFHSHAYSRNFSRVSDDFSMPRSLSLATTFASVAIEAWSIPGTQQAFFPCMRARRISTSCNVLLSMWPMWSIPVTLGGGMTTV